MRQDVLRDGAQTRREFKDALKEALKELSRQKRENLSEWRITVAPMLVRASRAPKAKIIDRLTIGSIAHFLTKHGPWTLIEYRSDEDGEMKQGWVLKQVPAPSRKKILGVSHPHAPTSKEVAPKPEIRSRFKISELS